MSIIPYEERVEYYRQWHLKHKVRRLAEKREREKRYKEEFDALMSELKSRPCTDCNRRFPPCAMDFDHVRGKKSRVVSAMRKEPIGTVKREVAKCELVCACCHRIRTHARGYRR